uniref:Cydiastatin-4 n=2 Tax=Endopterygota TaxID=33392 RepID=ALL4_CYDPO|nr:RecName: Full=Allatostatin-A1; Short=AST-A1; AltName: Full=ARPYSFGL-amide [Delia radicum]P82155.1 RecName: Full=Cydiastatin-4 [Cydia pomonella]
ARPYSFGL